MTPKDRKAVLDEVADFLAKHAQERDVAARNCAPGSFQRDAGQLAAREFAQMADKIRGLD